jgi:hypothetical protein
MTEQPPSLSEAQLKTAKVLGRLDADRDTRHMAKWLFAVLLVLFVVNSGFLLYAAFSPKGTAIAMVVSTAFDGLLGTLMVIVTRNLFPAKCKDKDGVIRDIKPARHQ